MAQTIDSLELELRMVVRHTLGARWEANPSSLKEEMLSAAEPSLQPPLMGTLSLCLCFKEQSLIL